MRKTRLGFIAALAAWTAAPALLACTATDVVDKAKTARDTETFRAARDVAEEEFDRSTTERGRDVPTLERDSAVTAGAASLLVEKEINSGEFDYTIEDRFRFDTSSRDWTDPQSYRDLLDNRSITHQGSAGTGGLTDETGKKAYRVASGVTFTVRDHLLGHAYEAIDPNYRDSFNQNPYRDLYNLPPLPPHDTTSGTDPVTQPSTEPLTEPAKVDPAVPPVPEADPVHHAG